MTTAMTVVQEVKGTLEKMQPTFAQSLPKHIAPERFIAVAQTAIVNNPGLLSLDKASLYQSFLQAAQAGLLPDNREAAIVPFKGKAKLMPMVAGICKQARNSGEISTIDSAVVFANDEYSAWADEKGHHFRHVKARGNRGEVILTFAYAIAKDGAVFFEEIEEEEMKKIEAMSRASDSPWKGPFKNEMRRKSALRRLAKYRLPNSADMAPIFEKDDEIYEEEPEKAQDTQKTTPTRLGAIIEAKAEPTLDQAEEMVKEAIPEAKVVARKPAPVKVGNPTAKGAVQNLTAKNGTDARGKDWVRYAANVGGNWYGTFDSKINDQLTTIVDAKQEVEIEYTVIVKGGKEIRNIVKVSPVVTEGEDITMDMVADEDIPI